MSILVKYSLWLGSVLLVVSGAIITAAIGFQSLSMTEQALLRGQSIAVNLAAPAGDALLRKNDLLLVPLSLGATRQPQVVYAAIVDAKGKVRGHADRQALGKPLAFDAQRQLSDAPEGAVVREGRSGGVAVWDISVPIRLPGTGTLMGEAHVGLARAGVASAVRSSLLKLALISLALLAAGLGLMAQSVRMVVRPLRELADAALRVGRGRFDTRVSVSGHDELGRLSDTFNHMAEGLEKAEQARAQHQRITSELDVARDLQASMLPARPPQVPGMEVAFRCTPAKELGGDFYDCIELEGGAAWGLLIADVSGKGVAAALNVVNLRNLFRVVAPTAASPAEAVQRVNALAYPDFNGESFVTLIYAVLRPADGSVRLLNAGHDPAYWLKADGSIQAFEAGAMPVGLAEAADYGLDLREDAFTLGPGERLLLFTDGVTEAMDAEGRQFGLDALRAQAVIPGTASETVLRLADAVSEHAGAVPPSDDVTLLAVRWTG